MSFSLITDIERTAYTYGDCATLARAVHEATGYPIVFYGGTETEDGVLYDDDTYWFWVHAFNVMPDGRYIDVNGIYTAEEIREQWHPSFLETAYKHLHVADFHANIWHPSHEESIQFMRFEGGQLYDLNVEDTVEKIVAAVNL